MIQLSRILCAVDFSRPARAAFARALALSREHNAELTVVQAVPVTEPFGFTGIQTHRRVSRSRVAVSRQLRHAIPQDALNWCDVQTRAVSGVPHRAILSTALEIKPDLIVMGLPTRSVLDTVFMGSTTSPVLRRAQCPVLTVPVPASTIESQTLMKSSQASALDSDLYSMVPSRASQTNRIGGLA